MGKKLQRERMHQWQEQRRSWEAGTSERWANNGQVLGGLQPSIEGHPIWIWEDREHLETPIVRPWKGYSTGYSLVVADPEGEERVFDFRDIQVGKIGWVATEEETELHPKKNSSMEGLSLVDYGNRGCYCRPRCKACRWRTGFECQAVWELAGWALGKGLSVVSQSEGAGRVVEISGWYPAGTRPLVTLEVIKSKLLEMMGTVGEVTDHSFTPNLGLVEFEDSSKGQEDAEKAVERFQGKLGWAALQEVGQEKHTSRLCDLHLRVMPQLEEGAYDSSDSDGEIKWS